ncbi:isoprenylcysteine carboxylmethyltransferase family protein [Mesorhizobium sp. NZP2077]|uniref:methyltransferase family protein n=1 Tax=Mesorhizobium sp. NZP2077 TaxID=2483404 RepID=UPI00155506D3|nr:isoprenylcysteine carboxylmethyltransferase family protein [Mesorhizobium sp. NZP2077]QKC82934.1 isoprenylcysteine carboxylmethyltransferase family protein [Mesorhizobium sp. NZP2077]QKD20098.1 isoprenylcysteine carboxylmethyltransferase family protein [Mesorhizobium sp. NZP2077]
MVACNGPFEGSSGCLPLLTSKSEALSHNNGGGYFSAARRRDLLVDLREGFFRLCALACAALFVYRGVYQVVEDPTRLNAALVAISEILTFTWLLLSRRPVSRDWNPLTVIVSVTASFGVALISLEPGVVLVPVYVAAPLQLVALLFVIWGKISLGRSFAILPANRGVMTGGAYRLVRHPIYAGYLAGHVLYLLSAFSFHNLAVYAVITYLQLYRILREEALLAAAPEYRAYMERVHYRLFYRIF